MLLPVSSPKRERDDGFVSMDSSDVPEGVRYRELDVGDFGSASNTYVPVLHPVNPDGAPRHPRSQHRRGPPALPEPYSGETAGQGNARGVFR